MRLIENELTREVKDRGISLKVMPFVDLYHLYLADLQKYFREEHMLEVSMILFNGGWWYQVETIPEQILKAENDLDECLDYNDTLERALLEALRLIK